MKGKFLVLVALAVAMTAGAASAEEIWREAESADTLEAPMQIEQRADASGGEYIEVASGNNSTGDPPGDGTAAYDITVEGGVYKIIGRVITPSGGDDSFWVRIVNAAGEVVETNTDNHGSGWVRWNSIAGGAQWHWDEVHSNDDDNATVEFNLSPGDHVLEIKYREDGTLLDGLVITNDLGLDQGSLPGLLPQPFAMMPNPADMAEGVTTPLLEWVAGLDAVSQNVYVSADAEITEADLVGPMLPGTMQIQPLFGSPLFVPGETLYWRVDSIQADQSVIEGDVWQFTVAPVEAWNASPAPGQPNVLLGGELSWNAGLDAISHDLYLGTDEAAVAAGDASAFVGNQVVTTFTPDVLMEDTTYYWRVDEVSATGDVVAGPVWSFSTVPTFEIADPDLLAWYKMDEGDATTVLDYSGNGRHASFADPAPAWVPGLIRGALEFDGDGDAAVREDGTFLNGLDALTITAWVKSDIIDTDKGFIIFEQPAGNDDYDLRYDSAGATGGADDVLKMGITVQIDPNTTEIVQLESSANSQTTEWQHVAMVWASGQEMQLYLNGELDVPSATEPPVTGTLTGFQTLILGKGGKDQGAGASWDGLIDDVRIYGAALSQEDVMLAMRGDPLLAFDPSPEIGAVTDIAKALPLMWAAGDMAAEHDVYLGTDQAAVADANTADVDVYRGRVNSPSFTPAEPLPWGQQYFWRIDEVNTDGSITKGSIWTFTLTDYLIVDEFETYGVDQEEGGNAIFLTWIDGFGDDQNGSQVGYIDPANGTFNETSNVHGGNQAMPFFYDNSSAPVSLAFRDFSPSEDWTLNGVTDLSLWIHGQAADFALVGDDGISMRGAGADIWNEADEFRYVYKTLNGDGSMTALVTGVGTGSNAWAKGGVMIRQDLAPGSVNALIAVTGGNGGGGTFQWRPTADAGSESNRTLAGIAPPYWVRLERTGDTFTGYMSADGETWQQNGISVDVAMNDPVLVGLAVTSHEATETRGYSFDNISSTGDVSGDWQMEDVGILGEPAEEGNDAADLFVVVEDSAGGSAKVQNPDPAVILTPAYQNWRIPLDSLTGVNLTRIERLTISVGDPDGASSGTGQILVDDIQVVKPEVVEE